MSGFRITGLVLVAVAWLQVNLAGRASGNPDTLAGGDRIAVVAIGGTHAPRAVVQFHQSHRSGSTCCFGKGVDWEVSLPEEPLVQTTPELKNIWPVAAAPDELLQTWQFNHRTAPPARAPCGV